MREEVVTFAKAMDSRLHIRMNPQCWALKDIRSNKIYNNGIEASPKTSPPKWPSQGSTQTTNLGCSWTFAPWHGICLVNTKDSVFLDID